MAIEGPELKWSPLEPQLVDYQFVLYDDRTREFPFAILVDVINTPKRGGMYHVRDTDVESRRSLDSAAQWFSEAKNAIEMAQSISVAYGVMYCLFAIRCAGRMPPIGLVHPVGHSVDVAIAELSQSTCGDCLLVATRALCAVADLLPNDETAARKLAKARSQAWSADAPGIAVLVDLTVVAPNPPVGER